MMLKNDTHFSWKGYLIGNLPPKTRQLLDSRIQIEQLRHDQVDGIFPVLKITLP
jgi:hypothetical protein